jgi:ABC-type transporter Mla subunit MlaD
VSGPLAKIASLPRRFLVGLKEFVDPSLKAGRIPYTRTILAMLLAAALVFVGYTLVKKQIRVPFSPEPYLVDVVFPDAAGLDPSKEPSAGVAGAAAGRVVKVVEEDGRAIVTLRLDPDLRGKIFDDATASLRPINVLQVLVVNVNPGTPRDEDGDGDPDNQLPEGEAISAGRTDKFVHIDELTSILDADTQAQVQTLISESATALGGKGQPKRLREILDKLGTLTDTATPLAQALDERRELIAQLVDHLDVVFETLGVRGYQLARAIDAGSDTLAVTAAREAELAEGTRLLAPVLEETQRSLAAARRLATPLNFALGELVPVAGNLEPAALRLNALIPKGQQLLALFEQLISEGRRPLRLFEKGTRGLGTRIETEVTPAVGKFAATAQTLDKFKGGIAQTADLWTAAFSTHTANGPASQIYLNNFEFTPEGFGLPAAAARSRNGQPSRMSVMLAKALEQTCRDESLAACALRFSLPALPDAPILAPQRKAGG